MKKYFLILSVIILFFIFGKVGLAGESIPTIEVKENPKILAETVVAPKNKEHGVMELEITKIKTKPVFATKIENGRITFELEKEKGNYKYHVVGKTENLPRLIKVNNKEIKIGEKQLQSMEYTYTLDTKTNDKVDILNININSIQNKEPYLYIGRVDEKYKKLLSVFSYKRNIIKELSTRIAGEIVGDIIEAPKDTLYIGAGLPGEEKNYVGTILKDEWWISDVVGGFAPQDKPIYYCEDGSITSSAKVSLKYTMQGIAGYGSLKGHYVISKEYGGYEGGYGDDGFKLENFYSLIAAWTSPFNSIWGPTSLTLNINLVIPQLKEAEMLRGITSGMFEIENKDIVRTITRDGTKYLSQNPKRVAFLIQREPVIEELLANRKDMLIVKEGTKEYYLYPLEKMIKYGYSSNFTPSISGNGITSGIKFVINKGKNDGIWIPKDLKNGEYSITIKMVNEYGDTLQKSATGKIDYDTFNIKLGEKYYEGEGTLNLTGKNKGSWGRWEPGVFGSAYSNYSEKAVINFSSGKLFDVRDNSSTPKSKATRLRVTREDGEVREVSVAAGERLVVNFGEITFGIEKGWDSASEIYNGYFFHEKLAEKVKTYTYQIEAFGVEGKLGELTLHVEDFGISDVGEIGITYDSVIIKYAKGKKETWISGAGNLSSTQVAIGENKGAPFIKFTSNITESLNITRWTNVGDRKLISSINGQEVYADGQNKMLPRLALPVATENKPITDVLKLLEEIVFNVEDLYIGAEVKDTIVYYDKKDNSYKRIILKLKVDPTDRYKSVIYDVNMSNYLTNYLQKYKLNSIEIVNGKYVVKEQSRTGDSNLYIGYNSGVLFDFKVFDILKSEENFTIEIDDGDTIQTDVYEDADFKAKLAITNKNISLDFKKTSRSFIQPSRDIKAIIKYKGEISVAEIILKVVNDASGTYGKGKLQNDYTLAPLNTIVKFSPEKTVAIDKTVKSTNNNITMLLNGNILSPYQNKTSSTITELVVVKNNREVQDKKVSLGTKTPITVKFDEIELGFEANQLYVKKLKENFVENRYEISAFGVDGNKLGTFILEAQNSEISPVPEDNISIIIDKRLHRFMKESGFRWLEVGSGKLSKTENFESGGKNYAPLIVKRYSANSWSIRADRWVASSTRNILESVVGGTTKLSREDNKNISGLIVTGASGDSKEFLNNLIIDLDEFDLDEKLETTLIGSDGTKKISLKLTIEDGSRDVSYGSGEVIVDSTRLSEKHTIQNTEGTPLIIDIPNNPSGSDLSANIYTTINRNQKGEIWFNKKYDSPELVLSETAGEYSLLNRPIYEVEFVNKLKGVLNEKAEIVVWPQKSVVYNHYFKIKAYYRPDATTTTDMVELGEYNLGLISKGSDCDVEISLKDVPRDNYIAWNWDIWKLKGPIDLTPTHTSSSTINVDRVKLRVRRGSMPNVWFKYKTPQSNRNPSDFGPCQVFTIEAIEDGRSLGSARLNDGPADSDAFSKGYSGATILSSEDKSIFFGWGGGGTKSSRGTVDLGGCFYLSRFKNTTKAEFKDLRVESYDHNGLSYGVINIRVIYDDIIDVGTVKMTVDGRLVQYLANKNPQPLLSLDGSVQNDALNYKEFIKLENNSFTIPTIDTYDTVEDRIKIKEENANVYYGLKNSTDTSKIGVRLPVGRFNNASQIINKSAAFDIYSLPLNGKEEYKIIYNGTDGRKYRLTLEVNVVNTYDKIQLNINPLNGDTLKLYTFENNGIYGNRIVSNEDKNFVAELLDGRFPNIEMLGKDVAGANLNYFTTVSFNESTPVSGNKKGNRRWSVELAEKKGEQYLVYSTQEPPSFQYSDKVVFKTSLRNIPLGEVEINITTIPKGMLGSATLDLSTYDVGRYSTWKADNLSGTFVSTNGDGKNPVVNFVERVGQFPVLHDFSSTFVVQKLKIIKNNLEVKEKEIVNGSGEIEFNDGVKFKTDTNGITITKTSESLGTDNYTMIFYDKNNEIIATFNVKVIKGEATSIGEIILTARNPVLSPEVSVKNWIRRDGELLLDYTNYGINSIGAGSYWSVTNGITQTSDFKEWISVDYRKLINKNEVIDKYGNGTVFSMEGQESKPGLILPNGYSKVVDAIENGIYKYTEFLRGGTILYEVIYKGVDNKNYKFNLKIIPKIVNEIESTGVIELSTGRLGKYTFLNSSIAGNSIPSREKDTVKLDLNEGDYIPEFGYDSSQISATATMKSTTANNSIVSVLNDTDGIIITTNKYKIKLKGRDRVEQTGVLIVDKLKNEDYTDKIEIVVNYGNGTAKKKIVTFNLTINDERQKESSATLDFTKVRKDDVVIWKANNYTSNLIESTIYKSDDETVERTYSGITFTNVDGDLYMISNDIYGASTIESLITRMKVTYLNKEYSGTINSSNIVETNELIFEKDSGIFKIKKKMEKITGGVYKLEFFDQNNTLLGTTNLTINDNTKITDLGEVKYTLTSKFKYIIEKDERTPQYISTDNKLYSNKEKVQSDSGVISTLTSPILQKKSGTFKQQDKKLDFIGYDYVDEKILSTSSFIAITTNPIYRVNNLYGIKKELAIKDTIGNNRVYVSSDLIGIMKQSDKKIVTDTGDNSNIYTETGNIGYKTVWRNSENSLLTADLVFEIEDSYKLGEGTIDISDLNIGGKVSFNEPLQEENTLAENVKINKYFTKTTVKPVEKSLLAGRGYFFATVGGRELIYKIEEYNNITKNYTVAKDLSNGKVEMTNCSFEIVDEKLIFTKTKNSDGLDKFRITVYRKFSDTVNIKLNEFILNVNNSSENVLALDLTKVRKGDTLTWDNTNYPKSKDIEAILPFDKKRTYDGVSFETKDISSLEKERNVLLFGDDRDIKKVLFLKENSSGEINVTNTSQEVDVKDLKLIIDTKNKSFSIQKLTEKTVGGLYQIKVYDSNNNLLELISINITDKTIENKVREEEITIVDRYKYMVSAEYEKIQYISDNRVYKGNPLQDSTVKSFELGNVLIKKQKVEGTYSQPLDLIATSIGTFVSDTTKKIAIGKSTAISTYGTVDIEVGTPVKTISSYLGIPLESKGPGTGDIYVKVPDIDSYKDYEQTLNIHWRSKDNTLVYGILKIDTSTMNGTSGSGAIDMSKVGNGESLKWKSSYNINTGFTNTSAIEITKGTSSFGNFVTPIGDFFPTITSESRLDSSIAPNLNIPKTLKITKKVNGVVVGTSISVEGKNMAVSTTAKDFPDVRFSIVNGEFIVKKLKRMESATYIIEASNLNGRIGTFELTFEDRQAETTLGKVTYNIYDKLKYVIDNNTTNIKWIGGTNGKSLYSYDSTAKVLKISKETFDEYLDRTGTITLPSITAGKKYKFVGVEKDRTATTIGTPLTEITTGIYGTNGNPEIELGTSMISGTGVTSINLDDIKINVTTAGKYSVKFLNEEDGDIYYFDVEIATKETKMDATASTTLEGVAIGSVVEFDISGKINEKLTPTSRTAPEMTIANSKVPYLTIDGVSIFKKVKFTVGAENKEVTLTDDKATTVTSTGTTINEFFESTIENGKLKLKKIKNNLQDVVITYTFYGKSSTTKAVDNTNILGTFTMTVKGQTPIEKKVTLSIDNRLLDEVGTTYTGVNLSGLKNIGTTTEYPAGDLTSFIDNTNNISYSKITSLLGVYKVTTTDTGLTKGADKSGMLNYGDSVYLAKTSSATTVEELLRELYFNPSNLKLNDTELSKSVAYKISYIGEDNYLYNLTMDVIVKKGVVIDGNGVLDFGKLLFDEKNPLHYGETNIVIKGLTKDKKVRIDIPTDKKNIELLSGTNKINVRNLDVGLITPTPTANNKKISEAVQTDGKTTFKIWGYAEVLKGTAVGIYEGETTVEVYIIAD